MSDLLGDSPPEGNNFDNDFEKLDPFSPNIQSESQNEDFVSSTSPVLVESDVTEPDLYTSSPPKPSAEAEPLLSFSGIEEPPSKPEPEVQYPSPPDSSTTTVLSSRPVEQPPAPPVKTDPPKTSSTGAWLKNIDPREEGDEISTAPPTSLPEPVLDLIYWRDVKKTGVVFGSMMVLLLSLALFSVLSVVAYLSLAALTITTSFVVYKKVLGAVQKTGEGHPFKQYLELDVALPEHKVHELADHVIGHASCTTKELRRLFLVEDIVDSLKFGLLLWVLTYIGAWFNGMTLIILGVLSVFTIPKFYETYKVQIDHNIDLVKTQIKAVLKQVQEKIPLPGKKKKEE